MKIEVRELMSDNEMLSHIFLGCIPQEKLLMIRDKFIDGKDWQKESIKISVEMKIGDVDINPKEFFNSWKNQMSNLISEKANEIVKEKYGSGRIFEIQNKLYEFENILKSWEDEINWEIENPFLNK